MYVQAGGSRTAVSGGETLGTTVLGHGRRGREWETQWPLETAKGTGTDRPLGRKKRSPAHPFPTLTATCVRKQRCAVGATVRGHYGSPGRQTQGGDQMEETGRVSCGNQIMKRGKARREPAETRTRRLIPECTCC